MKRRFVLSRGLVAAMFVLATSWLAAASHATAADAPPVPRLRPGPEAVVSEDAAPLDEQRNRPEEPPPTLGQRILLQGANSPFADAGVDAPAAATLPLNPPIASMPPAPALASVTPQRPQQTDAPASLRRGAFTLEARLSADGQTLGDDVIWRIYDPEPVKGQIPLLGEAHGGLIRVRLDPGDYIVHAAYGRAGVTRQITVNDPSGGEVFNLNAGGMRLRAINNRQVELGPGQATFDIYAPDDGGSDERYLVIAGAPPGRIIPLNAGTYHVVSHYGDANAIVRADIRIDVGQLTEATIFQRAAELTLKLVEEHGGEAIANTEWSVVTQGGENVIESVGAFPNVVLSEGEYIAIAKNNGRIFESNFTVVPGQNRDVEVLIR